MPANASDNAYTRAPIAQTFIRTALPIIILTSINGLLTVVDAIFLGSFVGPEALTAVTLMFPISMLLVALATMVSTGMSSVLARLLGGGRLDEAGRVFAGAHGLSLALSVALILVFLAFGQTVVLEAAGGSQDLAAMGHAFLAVSIFTAPVLFVLSVQSDALRIEGRVGFMALAGLFVSLANMALNYVMIVWLDLGVAGSAWGTALAQILALLAILAFRASGRARLGMHISMLRNGLAGWREILALGVPRSLTFIGISLGAAATILALRLHALGDADASIAAYGVLTRIMTFAYLPMLGMSLAMQAMVGNNYGAGLWDRSNASLKLVLVVALVYAGLIEIGLIAFRDHLGAIFTDDPVVASELAGILPVYVALYLSFGPMMIIASYFQAIGDAGRSAFPALARTYLFAIPLTFVLPLFMGEAGIWLATPIADGLMLLATAAVLASLSKRLDWGLFKPA